MRIKEVIKEKGLTVAIVAKRMGVDSPALSRVIHGNPTVEMLKRIAQALEAPITDLFEPPATVSAGVRCPSCGAMLDIEVKMTNLDKKQSLSF